MRARIKVCGIGSVSEVRAAVAAGADAVGVSGLIEDEAARIALAATPPGVTPVLMTQEIAPEAVVRHLRATQATVVQLGRPVDPRLHEALREAIPGLKIIQAVQVETEAALEFARAYAITADALLLDFGRPDDPVEAPAGGTDHAQEWRLARQIVSLIDKPVWLAGVTPMTLPDVLEVVHPFGLDLGGGARTMGKLDQKKLTGFFAAVRSAERSI